MPAPDDAFDAVIGIGHPDADYDLDLYGGTDDPDEAAGMLAAALVGDLTATWRRKRAACGDRAGAGAGPVSGGERAVPRGTELRELLDGNRAAVAGLRGALEAAGERARCGNSTRGCGSRSGPGTSGGCWRTGLRCWTGRRSPGS